MLCNFLRKKTITSKNNNQESTATNKTSKKATNSNKQLQHTFLNIKQQLNQAEDLLLGLEVDLVSGFISVMLITE